MLSTNSYCRTAEKFVIVLVCSASLDQCGVSTKIFTSNRVVHYFVRGDFDDNSEFAALDKQMYVYVVYSIAMMARKTAESERSSIESGRYKRFWATTDSGSRYSSLRATSGTIYRRRSQRRRR